MAIYNDIASGLTILIILAQAFLSQAYRENKS